jgi:hypothetical protein
MFTPSVRLRQDGASLFWRADGERNLLFLEHPNPTREVDEGRGA